MPRRLGWLHDYHYELDQGDRVMRDERTHPQQMPAQPSPVTVNVNLNLGDLSDLIDKIISRKLNPKEALQEAINRRNERKTLTEG